jgi:hypothetical protein
MAAWPHAAGDAVPVATGNPSQVQPVSISDGAGGAIIAWQDNRNGTVDVYAQRIDAYGNAKWLANGVLVCGAAGQQDQITMAPDGAGGAWIAWRDIRTGAWDIYGARISSAGIVTPPGGAAICTATGNQGSPKIAVLYALLGYAVVVWEDARSGNQDVYANRFVGFASSGWATDGVPVGSGTGNQFTPKLATNTESSRVCITWQDTRNGTDHVYAQELEYDGSPLWAANGVRVSATVAAETNPEIVLVGGSDYIVSWLDSGTGQPQVIAQRLEGSAGARQWGTNGVALAPTSSAETFHMLVSDNLGGAFSVWRDARAAALALYGQHVTPQGVPNWTPTGVPITTDWGVLESAATSDFLGGLLVSWTDSRYGNADVFAQRLNAFGFEYWTSNGILVANGSAALNNPVVSPDMSGGAILSWYIIPFGPADVFAKRADRWGILGAEPDIVKVSDVVHDQGGRVKVSWNASPLETDPLYEFVVGHYEVFRSVPTAAAMERLRAGARLIEASEEAPAGRPALMRLERAGVTSYWEEVGVQSAFQLPSYSLVVSTTGDSVGGSNPYTQFMVQARAGAGDKWWPSEPDSGYSVDNLAPAAPAAFTGLYSSGSSQLHWDPNAEPDLTGYRLYRGSTAGFVPGLSNLVAALGQTSYVDNAGAPYYYKLSAVDVHGNESVFATVLPAGTTDTPPRGATAELMLAPVRPNPVRGLAAARYAIPREAAVSLAIFDPSGRRVRSLFQGRAPAGDHLEYWDGVDDSGVRVPSSRYFLRLEFEGRVLTRSFALVR